MKHAGKIEINMEIDCGIKTCDSCESINYDWNKCNYFNNKLIKVTQINIMDNPREHNKTYLRLPECLEKFKVSNSTNLTARKDGINANKGENNGII